MSPPKVRGRFNQLFQLTTCVGILIANFVNYGVAKIHPWGWRLSLGLAVVPALIMFIGGLALPETPNSLVEQGKLKEAREVLERVRGTKNVDAEFSDLLDASKAAQAVKKPFQNLLQRKNRPQLVIGICIPSFQQLTGMNSILFYAPVLFQSLGFGNNASLYSSTITNGALVLAALISMHSVDKFGRRKFFLEAGVEMFISMVINCIQNLRTPYIELFLSSIDYRHTHTLIIIIYLISGLLQVIIGIILALKFGKGEPLSKGISAALVIFICIFVLAYGRSWGPLGWLVPSEIFPLETRSAGQSIVVCCNMFFTALVAQCFLVSLCHLRYGIFLLFAGMVLIMSIFIYFLLPETKQVPIEEIHFLWQEHWFWKRYCPPEVKGGNTGV